MPFITKYNFSKIIVNSEIFDIAEGEVYKKPIYFFNKFEKSRLLQIKNLLQLTDQYSVNSYAKIERKEDTKNWVFEGGYPAYHKTFSCPVLNSEYINFPIPMEIRNNGQVPEFREWFKENMLLIINGKEDVFKLHLLTKFGVQLQSKIQIPNSGSRNLDNLKLDELEGRVDKILSDEASFFEKASYSEKNVIRKYSQRAFLYKAHHHIDAKDTGMTEVDLRSFLMTYDTQFKTPVRDLLEQYYMVKYNPKLEFKGNLLEQLGFKQCTKCYSPTERKNIDSSAFFCDENNKSNSTWLMRSVIGDGEYGTIVGKEYQYVECIKDTVSKSGREYKKGDWFLIEK